MKTLLRYTGATAMLATTAVQAQLNGESPVTTGVPSGTYALGGLVIAAFIFGFFFIRFLVWVSDRHQRKQQSRTTV